MIPISHGWVHWLVRPLLASGIGVLTNLLYNAYFPVKTKNLKLLPVFLFLIPGMIAFALHQKYIGAGGEGFLPLLANGTANADAAFPTLVAKLLPAGVKGLVVCGILAALMSSLASLFNSSAMLFTIDFYKRFKPETPEKKLVG